MDRSGHKLPLLARRGAGSLPVRGECEVFAGWAAVGSYGAGGDKPVALKPGEHGVHKPGGDLQAELGEAFNNLVPIGLSFTDEREGQQRECRADDLRILLRLYS